MQSAVPLFTYKVSHHPVVVAPVYEIGKCYPVLGPQRMVVIQVLVQFFIADNFTIFLFEDPGLSDQSEVGRLPAKKLVVAVPQFVIIFIFDISQLVHAQLFLFLVLEFGRLWRAGRHRGNLLTLVLTLKKKLIQHAI